MIISASLLIELRRRLEWAIQYESEWGTLNLFHAGLCIDPTQVPRVPSFAPALVNFHLQSSLHLRRRMMILCCSRVEVPPLWTHVHIYKVSRGWNEKVHKHPQDHIESWQSLTSSKTQQEWRTSFKAAAASATCPCYIDIDHWSNDSLYRACQNIKYRLSATYNGDWRLACVN